MTRHPVNPDLAETLDTLRGELWRQWNRPDVQALCRSHAGTVAQAATARSWALIRPGIQDNEPLWLARLNTSTACRPVRDEASAVRAITLARDAIDEIRRALMSTPTPFDAETEDI